MAISIVLIDESRLFREGLQRIFEGSVFQIELESPTLDEFEHAQKSAGELRPELVLMDSRHSGQALLDQLNRLHDLLPDSRLVMLTDRMQLGRLAIALSGGVDGYLLKDLSGDALLQSLRLVLLGEKVFPKDLAHLLINGRMVSAACTGTRGRDIEEFDLSERERQILHCLANGYPNKVIANTLDITESTVKGHLKALLKKINVQNRTQAAVWALNHGVGEDIGHFEQRAAIGRRESSPTEADGARAEESRG